MQRKFLTYCLLFFVPVVLGYLAIEKLTRELPSSFKANEGYIEKSSNTFTTLILGSSQMQSAVNPEWLSTPTLNLASGDQHHDTDFKILKSMAPKLDELKTVIIEVSYSHFELPHNGPDFWKNSLYLKFYDVNAFERQTYFKDHFVYLSNPPFFSKKMTELYLDKTREVDYNEFGFNTKNYYGEFMDLDYDETKIAPRGFKINKTPNLSIFETNVALFNKLMEYTKQNKLQVILCEVPMYKTYHHKKHPSILKRRDSVVSEVLRKYSHVELFSLETDTLHYGVRDYWNQSHLNPNGAKKFSTQLDVILND